MKCPYCGDLEDRVIDSRVSQGGETTRRRRECTRCSKRFTTYERVEESLPLVVKKDGRREPFDHGKLLAGLNKACEKRPVSRAQIEGIVDAIERDLSDGGTTEVPSATIGQEVMTRLRSIDEVAYVRFASVYRSFRDIQEFVSEMNVLIKDRGDGTRG